MKTSQSKPVRKCEKCQKQFPDVPKDSKSNELGHWYTCPAPCNSTHLFPHAVIHINGRVVKVAA